MKKFLTVLLVIAVMFTFSFGSTIAWATTSISVDTYSEKLAEEYFDQAMEKVRTDETYKGITITQYSNSSNGSTWTSTKNGEYNISYDTLVEHKTDILNEVKYAEEHGAQTTYIADKDDLQAFLNKGSDYSASKKKVAGNGTTELSVFTYENLVRDLIEDQFEQDKTNALNDLKSLSVSDYSTEKLSAKDAHGCTTYADHVQYLIDQAIDSVTTQNVTAGSPVEDYKTAFGNINANFNAYVSGSSTYPGWSDTATNNITTSYNAIAQERGYYNESNAEGKKYVGLGTYEVNKCYVTNTPVSGTLNNYTTDSVGYNDATDAANIAVEKAEIASAYAAYVKNGGDKEHADNMKKVLDYLADKKMIKTVKIGRAHV